MATSFIFFDGDNQHDSSLLEKFTEELETHPVVLGVRSFDNAMPLFKIFLNRLASLLILVLFGMYIPDIPCGYKGLTLQAFKKINWSSSDYAVEMEIAARIAQYKMKYAVVQIPTVYHDLDRGMTILDTLGLLPKIIGWRLFP